MIQNYNFHMLLSTLRFLFFKKHTKKTLHHFVMYIQRWIWLPNQLVFIDVLSGKLAHTCARASVSTKLTIKHPALNMKHKYFFTTCRLRFHIRVKFELLYVLTNHVRDNEHAENTIDKHEKSEMHTWNTILPILSFLFSSNFNFKD